MARITDANGQGIPGLAVSFLTDGDVTRASPTGATAPTPRALRPHARGGIETLTVRTPLGSAAATLNEVPAASGPCDLEGEPGTWEELARMPTRRAVAAATGGDGRIYTFDGSGNGVPAPTTV